MMSVVLKLVCVLLCAVFVSAEVMPMTDFELEKMGGKWYLTGFATNAKWFVSRKANMKMGSVMMVPTMDGDLDLSCSNLKDDGTCWRMKHHAKKSETPGRFVFHVERWKSDNDMRVVDAKFNEYAIVHTINTKENVSEVLNKLYSRNKTTSKELMDKFKTFSLNTGILEENIAILPPNGECSDA